MLAKNTWKELPFSGYPDRCFHTSTLFKHYIITYGGYSIKVNSMINEIIEIFNLEKGQLEKFHLKGDSPQPLQRHSACLFDSNKILIFGGFTEQVVNDVAIITIEETSPLLTLNFTKMTTTGGENYITCSHTANVYQNKMYVFGGRINNKPLENTNELWSLNLENFHWEQCGTTGIKPRERTSHYSAIYDGKLYIFGGFHDSIKTIAQDCHIISLEDFHWEKLEIENINLLFRFSPSTVIVGDDMFIMGGHHRITDKTSRVISYNFKNNTIKNATSEGKYSDSRFATAVASESQIIIWGGQGIGVSFSQLSSLQIDHVYQGEEPSLPISSLLNSEQYSDIRLSIEGNMIPAHKFALGMRCKYFNDMFSSGMKESKAQILEITDVKLEAFQDINIDILCPQGVQIAFLKFLYRNRVEFTEPLAMDLYVLADKYMQKDLADVCENFLASSVNLENYEQMKEFAELYGAELLKETISEFVQENNSQESTDKNSQVAVEKDSK